MDHDARTGPTLTNPVRNPEGASPRTRTKRAVFLLLLTLFVPGGAQVVAGNRSLGRKALGVTLTCWFLILAVVAVALVNRGILLEFAARPAVQLGLAIVLGLLAIGWLVLFINTLALIRPRLLSPGVQAAVALSTVLLVLATSGVLGYGTYVLNTGRDTIQNVFAEGPAFDPVDGRYNLLVVGGDAGENREGLRADSISIYSVDARTGETLVISIPRNFQNAQFPEGSPLHAVFPDGFNCGDDCIINALYPTVEREYAELYPGSADAGAEATVDAAEGITGLEIQGYVVVDMAGFEEFIDAMGGVTIDSGGWVPYRAAPQETYPAVRTHWFPPGKQTFNGADALWFARSRYFTTDYHRIRRQQCMQQAMVAQFNPQTVVTRFGQIMQAGERLVRTDIPQDQLGSFISLADKARSSEFKRLTLGAPDFGTSADRFSTFPDFDQIHDRIETILNPPPAPPSPSGSDRESPAAGNGAAEEATSGASVKASERPASTSSSPEIEPTRPETTAQPDGSPLTEEYLVFLEATGQTGLLSEIASANDSCSVG